LAVLTATLSVIESAGLTAAYLGYGQVDALVEWKDALMVALMAYRLVAYWV
jgi:hypothetical protein